VFQFHDTMADSLGKKPKERNQSLMLLMKECIVTPLVFTVAIAEQSTVLHLVIAGNQGLVNLV
jgi:hypothetical protein